MQEFMGIYMGFRVTEGLRRPGEKL